MHDDEGALTLQTHEAMSEHRAEEIKDEVKRQIHNVKEKEMSATVFNEGLGGGMGGGTGFAAAAGAAIGAALFRRGGLGGDDGGDCVTPSMLTSAIGSVLDTNQNTAVLQGIGDIKAAVPLAEAQVQLALAQQASTLTAQATANANASAIAVGGVKDAVTTVGSLVLGAVKDGQYATGVAIANSTKEIIAALNQQNIDTLNRQLAVAEGALLEQRASGRARETEINVTTTVNQNQAQIQAQQQAQAQFQVLANLNAAMVNLAGDIQNIRQTQSNINFGVQGNAGQNAAATNNRVN